MWSKPIKHRARDAGETADLRWQLSVKLPVPAGSCAKLSVRAGPVRGWVALVPRGAKVRGSIATPACRAPSDFLRRRGWEVEMQGGPGAFSNNTGSAALA